MLNHNNEVLNVGSTEGSCDQQALETDRIQLKDTITSLRIQLDGLKVENVSLKRRYDELSKANTHSRTAYTEKINALTAEIAKLKTELSGKKKPNLPLNLANLCQSATLGTIFVIRSLKSVNTKTPHAKHSVNHTKKVWKATRNHNVNTTKTAWRPTGKIVGSVKPQWKPRTTFCVSQERPVADSIAARLTRPTAYNFKTDCSIIPV
ncbi:hypothetical protein Tco_1560737 [Tanacetum coccineum]